MKCANALSNSVLTLTSSERVEREVRSKVVSGLPGAADTNDVCAQAMEVLRSSDVAFEGQEVCLFVTFVAGDQLFPGPVALIKALVASGLTVVVCCAVSDMDVIIDLTGLDGAAIVLKRENGGYDFAVWAATLARMPELWSAKRLFFVNDSVLGPLVGFDRTLERIRVSDAAFLALTDSFEIRHHVQSYFFVLQNDGLSSEEVRTFWRQIRVEKTKTDVIQKYEVSMLERMRDAASLKTEVLFSYDFLFPGTDWSSIKGTNPTLDLWENLLKSGFPFVKVSLLYDPRRFKITHWPLLIAQHGGDVDMFRQHLSRVRETRGFFARHSPRWLLGTILWRGLIRAVGWAKGQDF